MADNQPDDEVADQEIVRRVTMLSESPATSIKVGELTKQSAGLIKNWRKRWFILTSDLLAYLDRKDGVVKGGILLENVTKVREASPAESGKHQYCFVVATADRDFVISAVSDNVRAGWISAISNATSAIKGGSTAPRLTSKPNAAVATTEPTLESAAASPSIGKFTFNYFPVFAKGPAIAIALDIAKLDWEGVFIKPGGTMETLADDWSALKPSTPFGELPLLTTPDLGDIGHELAILNYIGKKTTLGGADDRESCISAQLMQMAEDIYQKLLKIQPNVFHAKEDVVAAGTTEEFWTDSELTNNNATQGCAAYLSYLEKFHASCSAGSGRYTPSGTTIGEIKLFVTLHMMVMVKQECLDAFSAVKTFYDRFGALPAAKAVLETGSKFPRPFIPFFIAAKAPEPKRTVSAIAKLTYWDGRGNAELIRLMLAACGEPYQECVPFEEDATTHLSTQAQIEKIVGAGMLVFDQVPLLQIDGINLVQKWACVMYLARKHGLYGANVEEAALCDVIAEGIRDWNNAKPLEGGNAKYLPKLERVLACNSKGPSHLVGDTMSFVDVMFFNYAAGLLEKAPEMLGAYPLLQALHDRVAGSSGLSAYLASDQRFPSPGREGYFDRVKATIPWAFGLPVERPPTADKLTFAVSHDEHAPASFADPARDSLPQAPPVAFGVMSTAEITGKTMPGMTTVVAVASRDVAKAQAFIEKNAKLTKSGAKGEAVTYDDIVAHPAVEAIYCPLPTGLRNQWLSKAIAAGKHIYSEKPMGGTVSELKALLDECTAKGVQWMDGTMWYHSKRTRAIEQLLASGELGALKSVNAAFTFHFPDQEWLDGGNGRTDKTREPMGCLGDQGWYPLSAILWAFGWELPERVMTTSTTLNKVDTIVACSGVLFFKDGRVANFDCGCTATHRSQFEIVCENGSVRVDDLVGGQGRSGDFSAYFVPFVGSGKYTKSDVMGKDTVVEVPECDHVDALVNNFSACVDVIKKGGKPNPDWPRRSLAVHTVISAVFESANSGGKIVQVGAPESAAESAAESGPVNH